MLVMSRKDFNTLTVIVCIAIAMTIICFAYAMGATSWKLFENDDYMPMKFFLSVMSGFFMGVLLVLSLLKKEGT